jgi:hypothetical protein
MSSEQHPVASRALTDGTTLVEDSRGSARLSRLSEGVLFYECTGYLSASFYAPMVSVAEREMKAAGRVAMFVDGWELRSVDSGFREAWTVWFKAHKERFHMRLLVRTKLMDMAASLANLFTGMTVIKTYSSIALWERACVRDFRGFRGRSKASG